MDGLVNIADVTRILLFLFRGSDIPACEKAYDVDDSGLIDLTDSLQLASHLFGGRAPNPEPAGTCGEDPTEDDLTCDSYPVAACD